MTDKNAIVSAVFGRMNTRLAAFQFLNGQLVPIVDAEGNLVCENSLTGRWESATAAIRDFTDQHMQGYKIQAISFSCPGFEGPGGWWTSDALRFAISSPILKSDFDCQSVWGLNRLQARVWALNQTPDNVVSLYPGSVVTVPRDAHQMIYISFGSRLSTCFVKREGELSVPGDVTHFGLTGFSADNDAERFYKAYLAGPDQKRHVTWGDACTLSSCASFYMNSTIAQERAEVVQEFQSAPDQSAKAFDLAREGRSPACIKGLSLFWGLLGRATGQCILGAGGMHRIYVDGAVVRKGGAASDVRAAFRKGLRAVGTSAQEVISEIDVRFVVNSHLATGNVYAAAHKMGLFS